jgi:hypothetical protein
MVIDGVDTDWIYWTFIKLMTILHISHILVFSVTLLGIGFNNVASWDSLSDGFCTQRLYLCCSSRVELTDFQLQLSILDRLAKETESELLVLYDWWFTANLFVLAPSFLRITTRYIIATEPLLSSHPLWREGGICFLWIGLVFVKCEYRASSM